jgi:hypothetical protein
MRRRSQDPSQDEFRSRNNDHDQDLAIQPWKLVVDVHRLTLNERNGTGQFHVQATLCTGYQTKWPLELLIQSGIDEFRGLLDSVFLPNLPRLPEDDA